MAGILPVEVLDLLGRFVYAVENLQKEIALWRYEQGIRDMTPNVLEFEQPEPDED